MESSNFPQVTFISKAYVHETPTHLTPSTPKAHGEETPATNPLTNPFNCPRKLYYGDLRQAFADADFNGKRKISIEDHHDDTGKDAKRSRRGRSRSRSRSRSLSLSLLRSASKKIIPVPQIKSQSRQWSRKFSRKFTLRSQKPHVVGRKSRFIEASMHDRPSERPPSIFMQEARATECAMEQYMTNLGGDEDWEESEESPQSFDAGIDPAKPSAIWGLGKALVNVFNPRNVWQGLNGMFKEKEPEQKQVNVEDDLFTQQMQRAEQAYYELKMSEYRGRQEMVKNRQKVDVPTVSHGEMSKQRHSVDLPSITNDEKLTQRHSVDVPSITNEDKLRQRPSVRVPSTSHDKGLGQQRPNVRIPSFPYDGNLRYPRSVYIPCAGHEVKTNVSHPASPRDFGVDVDGYRSSLEHKSERIVFDPEVRQPPPAQVPFGRPASPFPDVKPLPRASLHFRKPSLLSLKKVKSHLQLPSLKKDSALSTRVPSMESDFSTKSSFDDKAVKKQLSKKDLHKQLKLSKKVSDLESKLEKTRRDLKALTREEDIPPIPTTPKRFPPIPTTPKRFSPIPTTPKRFVPSALASLPSERILFEHAEARVVPLADDDVFVEWKIVPCPEDDVFWDAKVMPLADNRVAVEKEEYDWGEDVF